MTPRRAAKLALWTLSLASSSASAGSPPLSEPPPSIAVDAQRRTVTERAREAASAPDAAPRACDRGAWRIAAQMSMGVATVWDGTGPRVGGVFAPGLRSISTRVARGEVDPSASERCGERVETFGDAVASALVGTEYGLDFPMRIVTAIDGRESILGTIGVALIGRTQLGRWRVPSLLGVLAPEVGAHGQSVPAALSGPRAGMFDGLWSLYVRPAGWAVSYVGGLRRGAVMVTLDVAPMFVLPFDGRPVSVSASASASFAITVW